MVLLHMHLRKDTIKECMGTELADPGKEFPISEQMYDYVRLEDITKVNEAAGCEQEQRLLIWMNL